MKKLVALLMVGLVTSVCADLTEFNWFSASTTDGLTGSDFVNTYLDVNDIFDMASAVSGGQLDISVFNSFIAIDSQTPNIITSPPPVAGKWSTGLITGDGSWVGLFAFAVITDGSVGVGDTIRIGAIGNEIIELFPDGAPSRNPAQIFDAGTLTDVQIVPEPATALLFGIGGLGAFIVRRNKRKAQEEADA